MRAALPVAAGSSLVPACFIIRRRLASRIAAWRASSFLACSASFFCSACSAARWRSASSPLGFGALGLFAGFSRLLRALGFLALAQLGLARRLDALGLLAASALARRALDRDLRVDARRRRGSGLTTGGAGSGLTTGGAGFGSTTGGVGFGSGGVGRGAAVCGSADHSSATTPSGSLAFQLTLQASARISRTWARIASASPERMPGGCCGANMSRSRTAAFIGELRGVRLIRCAGS